MARARDATGATSVRYETGVGLTERDLPDDALHVGLEAVFLKTFQEEAKRFRTSRV